MKLGACIQGWIKLRCFPHELAQAQMTDDDVTDGRPPPPPRNPLGGALFRIALFLKFRYHASLPTMCMRFWRWWWWWWECTILPSASIFHHRLSLNYADSRLEHSPLLIVGELFDKVFPCCSYNFVSEIIAYSKMRCRIVK